VYGGGSVEVVVISFAWVYTRAVLVWRGRRGSGDSFCGRVLYMGWLVLIG